MVNIAQNNRLVPKKGKKRGSYKIKETITGYIFVAPMLMGMCVFTIYPVISAFLISLKRTAGIGGTWIGLANYKYVLKDSNFWRAVYNTLFIGLFSLAGNIGFSFIVASMINNITVCKNFFKSAFFLPNIVSVVATSILFTFVLYPTKQGILNYILGFFCIKPVAWFADPSFARFGIVLMGIWQALGYYTLIFLAGLQSISKELYEAAKVDGSNKFQNWWHITIPCVKPIFVFLIMMGTISAMKRFGDVWMIGGTAGNPGNSLSTVVLYIYRNAFYSNMLGVASAASYILFFIILGLTILNNKFLNKSNIS